MPPGFAPKLPGPAPPTKASASPAVSTPAAAANAMRLQVAKEILATELTYVRGLEALVQLYVFPLQKKQQQNDPDTLPPADFQVIFGMVPMILNTHVSFIGALQDRWDAWAGKDCLGDLFLQFAHFFKMYTSYVNTHDNATALLKKMAGEKKFEWFQTMERECVMNPKSCNLNLASLLITPIQRIPRYKLLLTELLKHTPSNHPDHKQLTQAVELVGQVATHINDALRAAENRHEIIAIQDSFLGTHNLLEAHRKFIRKGKLMRVCRRSDKLFTFFLFNDLLLYASQKGWKYTVHRTIQIHHESFRAESHPSEKDKHKWKITSAIKSFVVYSIDKQEKLSWLADLKACIEESKTRILSKEQENVQQGSMIQPVWSSNSDSSNCMLCAKKFNFVRRKHHCRQCGILVCDDCSKARAQLGSVQNKEQKEVRVCNNCSNKKTEPGSSTGINSGTSTTTKLPPILPSSPTPSLPSSPSNLSLSKTTALEMDQLALQAAIQSVTDRAKASRKKDMESSGSAGGGMGGGGQKETVIVGEVLQHDIYNSWIWLPDKDDVYVAAKVLSETSESVTFRTLEGEIVSRAGNANTQNLHVAQEQMIRCDVEDMATLADDEFSQPAILHQLRERYKRDFIYTQMGGILVAINPFKQLGLYSSEQLDLYSRTEADKLHSLAPHIFKIAAEAFLSMLEEKKDQSIVISGESGSGKTETTKLILQYFSNIAGSTTIADFVLDKAILQSNPFLEAFGNAKTVRNNNSSRFGKWISVMFSLKTQTIVSASIDSYLLEMSRVVKMGNDERGYHIFYQICAAANKLATGAKGVDSQVQEFAGLFKEWALKPATYFKYLNQSAIEIDGLNDVQELSKTIAAMKAIGFSLNEIQEVFRVVSCILHLGNISFVVAKDGCADVFDMKMLSVCASVLQVESESLKSALTSRIVKAPGTTPITVKLKADEALDTRDVLAKALYNRMFAWCVQRVNQSFHVKLKDAEETKVIGVLDIFGFEVFDINSLEQLFINYANEKLQAYFNETIFAQEFLDYKNEGIESSVTGVTFKENNATLFLIERLASKGVNPGIIALIDEEIRLPKPSDVSLQKKINDSFAEMTSSGRNTNPNLQYSSVRKPQANTVGQFIIKHYSGEVLYTIDDFVKKSTDRLHDSLCSMVRLSKSNLIASFFPSEETDEDKTPTTPKPQMVNSPSASRSAAMMLEQKSRESLTQKTKHLHKGKSVSLGIVFKDQLSNLMDVIQQTNPHFVRCIQPNTMKQPYNFQSVEVMRQMMNGGLFEALRIRRLGFPFRKPHSEFWARYEVLLKLKTEVPVSVEGLAPNDYHKRCLAIVEKLQLLKNEDELVGASSLDLTKICVGKTKVFWNSVQRFVLENMRRIAMSHNGGGGPVRRVLLPLPDEPSEEPEEDDERKDAGLEVLAEQERLKLLTQHKEPKQAEPPVNSQASKLAVHSLATTSAKDAAERKALQDQQNTLKKEYTAFLKLAGAHKLEKTKILRDDKNFWKNVPKKDKNDFRLVFQNCPLYSSLVKMDEAAFTAAKSVVERLEKLATRVFDNILYFTQVKFHAYPISTGQAVCQVGRYDVLLRDEIYCQLIKQTTPSKLSSQDQILKGWMLIYLCMQSFPAKTVDLTLCSHLASFARKELPANLTDLNAHFGTVEDIATHCLLRYALTHPNGVAATIMDKDLFVELPVEKIEATCSGNLDDTAQEKQLQGVEDELDDSDDDIVSVE